MPEIAEAHKKSLSRLDKVAGFYVALCFDLRWVLQHRGAEHAPAPARARLRARTGVCRIGSQRIAAQVCGFEECFDRAKPRAFAQPLAARRVLVGPRASRARRRAVVRAPDHAVLQRPRRV